MSRTKRPQNVCRNCGYTWYPRGRYVSTKCPNCGSTHTTTGCLSTLGCLLWPFKLLASALNSLSKTRLSIGNKSSISLLTLLVALILILCACSIFCLLADSTLREIGILPTRAPTATATQTPTATATATAPTHTPIPTPLVPTVPTSPTLEVQVITHTVQAGETLTIIANKYNVQVDILIKLNDIKDPNSLQVGQVLIIREGTSAAVTPAAQTITTAEEEVMSVPGAAYTDGRDSEAKPPLTVMQINIWRAVPRDRVVCQLEHGSLVQLLEARYYTPESRYYFRLRSGTCEGWLSENFLSATKQEPIGDQIR